MALYKKEMGSVLDAKPAPPPLVRKRVNEPRMPVSAVPILSADGLTPQQRWRQKNADHVRAKQREYQKAYRDRKRAEK